MRIVSQHNPGALEQHQGSSGASSSELLGAAWLCLGFAPLGWLKAGGSISNGAVAFPAAQLSPAGEFAASLPHLALWGDQMVWGNALELRDLGFWYLGMQVIILDKVLPNCGRRDLPGVG